MAEPKGKITELLLEIRRGSDEAYDRLFSMVYDELKAIAYREIKKGVPQQTITKTSLVHEAYLKLAGQEDLECENRAHFFALVARAMRFILIDYARKKAAVKREGELKKVTYLDELMKIQHKAEELIDLDEALNKLAKLNERLVKVVELRYFGQMTIEDTAEVMEVSPSTVTRDWAKARGWLFQELKEDIF